MTKIKPLPLRKPLFTTTSQPEYIDRATAADLLGMKEATLAAWACSHKYLPYYKIGRTVRYRREDIETLLENGRVNIQE